MDEVDVGYTCETAEIAPATYVVTLAGELDLAVAADVAQAFETVFARGAVDLVVDLRRATFVDSTTISVIVAAARLAAAAGGTLAVTCDAGEALRTVRRVELDQFVPVHRNLSTAVAGFARI